METLPGSPGSLLRRHWWLESPVCPPIKGLSFKKTGGTASFLMTFGCSDVDLGRLIAFLLKPGSLRRRLFMQEFRKLITPRA